MDKKYQVFVSSTYEDLIRERSEVMHALLELDCIPAGMELFPASNESQWEVITSIIDECDYYILILGGRYGSLGPDGKGYTEKEYDYAIEKKKPIISFLHKDPESLPKKNTEQTDEGQKRYEKFRGKIDKTCKFWSNYDELGGVVSRSLIQLRKTHPAIGWVRADQVSSEETAKEILDLRKTIDDLRDKLEKNSTSAPEGVEDLAQGDDLFELNYTVKRAKNWEGAIVKSGIYNENSEKFNFKINLKWREIFYVVLPKMFGEASNKQIRQALNSKLSKLAYGNKKISKLSSDISLLGFSIDEEDLETIIIQLKALGIIIRSMQTRAVTDKDTYWVLTPYGERVMNQLRAVKSTVG